MKHRARVQHTGQTSYHNSFGIDVKPKDLYKFTKSSISVSVKSDQGANPQKNEICNWNRNLKCQTCQLSILFLSTFFNGRSHSMAHMAPIKKKALVSWKPSSGERTAMTDFNGLLSSHTRSCCLRREQPS